MDKTADELTPEAVEDLYYAEARLGVEIEKFLPTNVGRYLVGRAEQELVEAHQAMEKCSPDELQELQNKAWRAKSFADWLAEAINNGRSAEFELNKQEEIYSD